MEMEWCAPMKGAISEVLETMFFEMAEFDRTPAPFDTLYLKSTIGLTRADRVFHITFLATEFFARSLGSNFLSKNRDEVSREDLEDMMRELANMIGGSFLSRMREQDWQLQIPAFISHKSTDEGVREGLQLSREGRRVGMVSVEQGTLHG